MNKCTQLKDLLDKEIPALKVAYLHRQLLLSQELETLISYKVAEKDFNEKYIKPFAEGFKLYFCNNACPDRDNCEIKESEEMYNQGLEDFVKYFKDNEVKPKGGKKE